MNTHVGPATGQYEGISVVIPAYRSPGTLRILCDQLNSVLRPLTNDLEIIIVDDGSGDGTWSEIERLAVVFDNVNGILLFRNFGQHNALLAGLRAARLPVHITLDDDLQHPPHEIPVLLDALTDDLDLVYGRPATERQSMARNVASVCTKHLMARALGSTVYPRPSAFRVFRSELLEASATSNESDVSVDVLLGWATTRIIDVEVQFNQRTSGSSGYRIGTLVRHAFNMITGYSVRPLHWVGLAGTACAATGFAMLLYVLVRFIVGDSDVQGFTFLAASVTLFSGVQLLSLGVLGEYLGRVHFRTMGKPSYAIRTTTQKHLRETDT